MEDEPERNRRIADGLGDEGFVVDTATSLTECVSKLQEDQYDVVLLDIMLPPGDDGDWSDVPPIDAGVALLERLRAGELSGVPSDLPVVVLTAITRHEAALQRLGVAGYLYKPCSIRDVVGGVAAAFEGGGD